MSRYNGMKVEGWFRKRKMDILSLDESHICLIAYALAHNLKSENMIHLLVVSSWLNRIIYPCTQI